jgi:predicted DNA-binding protein YlxM (UPF0122 family)
MVEEKSIFVQVFGGYPLIKVLDFLITFREFDYSLTEIAENSSVGWTTLHTIWPKLVKLQIVKQTRQIGRAKLYKLNSENPVVKNIIRLDKQMCSYYAEFLSEKQVAKVIS